MKDCIERLRTVFTDYAQGRAHNQPRRRLTMESGAVLHQLAGGWGKYFGAKIYSTHVKYGANFTVLLYDAETARPLARFEANALGQIRTGAVCGLAADYLAPTGRPLTVGCIGSGFQAHSQLVALAAVRPLGAIRVWSRNDQKRAAFASEMSEALGQPVEAAESASAALEAADITVTATWAKDPVLTSSDVTPGSLVLAMGSNNPQRRELPGDLVTSSFVVVEDQEACRIEAGDLLLAFSNDDWDNTVELRALVTDPGTAIDQRGNRTTVFKSVGLGLEDIAAASLIYERA